MADRKVRTSSGTFWSRGIRGVLVIASSCALVAVTSAATDRPTAETILRRADQVLNPYLGITLDLELSVVSRPSGRRLRDSRHTLLMHRNGRTLILMPQKDHAAPGALLIADDNYWLLLPHAERPVELAFRHVVAGDLSHAGFLRVNLRLGYAPRFDGEETLDDVPCWRLELEPRSESAPFGRVRYWVTQRGFLPIRIEFYTRADELLKTARFTSYQETGVGLRPARIEIEDTRRARESTTLTLSRPTGIKVSKLDFDLEDLVVLRDEARRLAIEGEAPVSGKQLVAALAASARARGAAR